MMHVGFDTFCDQQLVLKMYLLNSTGALPVRVCVCVLGVVICQYFLTMN